MKGSEAMKESEIVILIFMSVFFVFTIIYVEVTA